MTFASSLSSRMESTLKKLTLHFDSPDLENQFVQEHFHPENFNAQNKRFRAFLTLAFILQYLLLTISLSAPSLLSTNWKFRVATVPFIIVILAFRHYQHFRPSKWLRGQHLENFDTCILIISFVFGGVISATNTSRNPSVLNLLIVIIECPIVFITRFSKNVVAFGLGIPAFLILCNLLDSGSSASSTAFNILVGILVGAYQLLGIAQSEQKLRQNFLLRREMKHEYEKKIQMAQEIAEAKNRMVSVISHELRTPLQAISAMSGLLAEADLSEPDREIAGIINRSSDLLTCLVNDVLDMNRLHSNALVLRSEPVDLEITIEETLDLLSANLYRHRNIEIAHLISENVSRVVNTDGQRLKQIVSNLTANAVKFCESGCIHISFSLAKPEDFIPQDPENQTIFTFPPIQSKSISAPPPTPRSDQINISISGGVGTRKSEFIGVNYNSAPQQTPPHYLCLTVWDTGVGIERKNLGKVFDDFFMGDDSPSRRFNGTGLGLAIVKRTTLAMGGIVQVSSQGQNQGATFRVFLPYDPISPSRRPSATKILGPFLFPASNPFFHFMVVNAHKESRECGCALLSGEEFNQNSKVCGFDSLGDLESFLSLETTSFMNEQFSPYFVAILVDSNALGQEEENNSNISLSPLFSLSKKLSLYTKQNIKIAKNVIFRIVLVSPVDTSNQLLSLQNLKGNGIFTKLAKPLRRRGVRSLIDQIVTNGGVSMTNSEFSDTPISPTNSSISSSGSRFGSMDNSAATGGVRISISEISETPTPIPTFRRPSGLYFSETPQTFSELPLVERRRSSLGATLWAGSHLRHELEPPPVITSEIQQKDGLKTILIVDDNKVVHRVLSKILGAFYSCDLASDGEEALKMIDENTYSCVIMDFHMDGMDGITATKHIRQRSDEKAHIPIIGLSADGLPETHQAAHDAGMNTFFVKPINKDKLLEVVKDQLVKSTTSVVSVHSD